MAGYYVLDSIGITGNRVTRTQTILRLLEAQIGDTIRADSLSRAWNALLLYNTDLFNQVTIQQGARPGHWHIAVEERWYLWPYLRFRVEDVTLSDWVRNPVFYRVTYALGFYRNNLTGRQDKLQLVFRDGYKRGFTLSYNRPFLFVKPKIDAYFYFNYFQNDEVNYGARSGEVLRLRQPNRPVRTLYEGSIALSKRLSQTDWLQLSPGYRTVAVQDSLTVLNPSYLPGQRTLEAYPYLALGYVHDSRRVRAFPLAGYKWGISLAQYGLGVGTSQFWKLQGHFRRFIPLGLSRWNLAYGLDAQHIFYQNLPFYEKAFVDPDVGARGYESFFVSGTTLLDAKTELKYALIPWRIREVSWLPRPFRHAALGLYPYVYADTGYMEDRSQNGDDGTYLNKLLGTVGIGLYVPYIYDNLLRLEYGLNVQGQARFQFNFVHALR
ncbi:MAG: hypothetical protein LW884_10465 [Bacteroidetes bacterium]|nr:hypothetical protein [Bacteroidota bacterium]